MGIVLFASCSNDVKINGDFSDGGDMNVSLERIGLDNTSVPVDNQKWQVASLVLP